MDVHSENEKRAFGLLSEINNLSKIGIFLENVIDDLFNDFKKKFKEKVLLLIEQLEQNNHVEEKNRKKYELKNEIEKKERKIEQKKDDLNNPLNDSVLNVYIKQVTQYNKDSLIKQLHSDLNDEEINHLFEKTKENEKIIHFNSTKDIDLEKMFPTISQVSEKSFPNEKKCKESKKEVFKTIRKNKYLYPDEQKQRSDMKIETQEVANKWEIVKGIHNGLIEKKFNFNERIIEPIKLKNEKDSEMDSKKMEKIEEKKEMQTKYCRRIPPFTAKNDETRITDYFSNRKRNADSQFDINKNSYIYKYCTSSGIKKSDTGRKQAGEEHLSFKICDGEKEKKEEKLKLNDQNSNPCEDMVTEEKNNLNGFLSCDSDEINYGKLKLETVCKKEKNVNNREKSAQRDKTDYLLKDNCFFSKEEKIKNIADYITKKQKIETNDIFPKSEMQEIKNIKIQHHKHQHEHQNENQHEHQQHKKKKDVNLFYEVVRGKERKNLKGFDCAECKLFYEEFLSECSEDEKKSRYNKKKWEDVEKNRTDNTELKTVQNESKNYCIEDKSEKKNSSFFEDVVKSNMRNNGVSTNENTDKSAVEIKEEVSISSERNMSQISFEEQDYYSVHLGKRQKHDANKKKMKTKVDCEIENNKTSENNKAEKKKEMLQSFSRHRYHNKVNDSPQGFWGFDFFK